MSSIDLTGKTALVAGVADNVGFGWHLAKSLMEANAKVIISCHPRVINILDSFLSREKYRESRKLKNGKEFLPHAIIPCDLSLDDGEFSISELKNALKQKTDFLSILIHSVAFSPEIKKNHLEVSRNGYLTSMSVSSYSLISLCRNLKDIFDNKGASVIALSYLASERAVPFYGGGMASAKAALECDARMLCWLLGKDGHRINILSPGPYASRAAKAIGDIDALVSKTSEKSPLRRSITPEEVADAALFFASDLSRAITGEVLHVDCGFHAMALV